MICSSLPGSRASSDVRGLLGILACVGCGVTPNLANRFRLRALVACSRSDAARVGGRVNHGSIPPDGTPLPQNKSPAICGGGSVTSAERPSKRSYDRQRLIEIGDNIVDMLDTDRKPNVTVGNAGF